MNSTARVAILLVAFVAVLHGSHALECYSCSTHSDGGLPAPPPGSNETSSDGRRVVEINPDEKHCRSQLEQGGTIKGAVVIKCNATVHNACYSRHTYLHNKQGEKTADIWARGCTHVEEEDNDECTMEDGHESKTDNCFCSSNKCNNADTRSVAMLPLFASLVMGIYYAFRH